MRLISSLQLNECKKRLQEATERDTLSPFGRTGSKPYVAKIRNSKVRIRTRWGLRNLFPPCFYGKLQSDGIGTRLVGKFKAHPFVRAFMFFWLSGVALLGGVMVFAALSDLAHGTSYGEGSDILGVIGPIVLFLFGFFRARAIRKRTESRSESTKRFLREVLDAYEK